MEAQKIGSRLQHQAVDVEHLMLALLGQQGGLVPSLFERAKVAPELLRARLEEELARVPGVPGGTTTDHGLHVTQRLNKLNPVIGRDAENFVFQILFYPTRLPLHQGHPAGDRHQPRRGGPLPHHLPKA